ncbi:protein SENSITIVITY TO RED LIGHT REDUCED 1-like [Prosopis cineraria]|uniref:protein SENSITIVITY TO RED LIGHT REDUCED 1-like n=1 Tax=Prosopis cineraria TaxID=364024 RepID=UPI00240FD5B1|nr:protein SENSITIVITY TO RED LIGHT REDUCED 1-like [Prosopis cineraria]
MAILRKTMEIFNSLQDLKTSLELNDWGKRNILKIVPFRKKILMWRMKRCINKLESSQFYHNFRHQVNTPTISGHFSKFLGSDSKAQMVIYGIGNIELEEISRLQLSLAMLMKKDFGWIELVEVFDPVISKTESQVMKTLGCSVLSINEHGRREAMKPTIFFMPHCEIHLYNNLMETNWELSLLRNLVILGNSFEEYRKRPPFIVILENNQPFAPVYGDNFKKFWKGRPYFSIAMEHVMSAEKFTNEFRIDDSTYFAAFAFSSWHFFNPCSETELVINYSYDD